MRRIHDRVSFFVAENPRKQSDLERFYGKSDGRARRYWNPKIVCGIMARLRRARPALIGQGGRAVPVGIPPKDALGPFA
jgi:hypothetical protein